VKTEGFCSTGRASSRERERVWVLAKGKRERLQANRWMSENKRVQRTSGESEQVLEIEGKFY